MGLRSIIRERCNPFLLLLFDFIKNINILLFVNNKNKINVIILLILSSVEILPRFANNTIKIQNHNRIDNILHAYVKYTYKQIVSCIM